MSDVEYYVETVSVSEAEERPPHMPAGKRSFGGIVPNLLIFLAFLLPIFFIPVYNLSTELSKVTLLAIFSFFGFLIWLVARLRAGVLVFPKTWLLSSVALILVATLVSAILSPAVSVSLFGIGSEVHTFWFLLVSGIAFFLTAVTVRNPRKILSFFVALTSAFLLLFLFHVIRLLAGADVLSFGLFNSQIASILGKWNDIAIFSGLIGILVMFALLILSPSRLLKIFLWGILGASLFLLALVNFNIAWIMFGVFSLIAVVYAVSFGDAQKKGLSRIAPLPTALIIIAVFAVVFAAPIGTWTAQTFGFSNFEVRPTWKTTVSIINETFADDPLWGIGPNRFYSQWLLHKPDSVISSIFWNTDFNTGVGFIPTFAVTTGSVGALSWVLFFLVFLWSGIGILTHLPADRLRRFLLLGTYLGAAWLWIFAFFYVPNAAMFTLAFLFTGLFIAMLSSERLISVIEWRFSDKPQKSFVTVLVLIFFCIVSVVGLYVGGQKLFAATVFQKGQVALSRENGLDAAIADTRRAIEASKHDIFYRALAGFLVADLREIYSRANAQTIDDIRLEFRSVLGSAIESAQNAIDFDETNYQNWRTLARIYAALVPLDIPGAYENALQAYDEVGKRNPKNPSIFLERAQMELARGNSALAKEEIGKSLVLKKNYTDALFLLSQIEMNEGKLTDAISSVEIASLINPNDPGIFFRLGFLRYSNRDYRGAISAFEVAVRLQPNYANAKYFLGLAYYQTDKTEKAIAEFEDIQRMNPDNAEVQAILLNLRSGKEPFANSTAPAPEERRGPPLEE